MSSTQQLLLGEGAGGSVPVYVEEVFAPYIYSPNGTSQTITNNINLSTKGGLVWIKIRDVAGVNQFWTDTVRGAGTSATVNKGIASNLTTAENLGGVDTDYVSAFTSSGFTVQAGGSGDTAPKTTNTTFDPTSTYISWTFAKQAKFFDIVTYTGNGANRTIAHNLGSTPACMLIKRLNGTSQWTVYHAGLAVPETTTLTLNTSDARATGATTTWNSTNPTSSVFSLGTSGNVNTSGATYVAYLFASNAGGFGLTGTDNVITCGSYIATDPAPAEVTLGYEPQFVLVKDSTNTGQEWYVVDNMRSMAVTNARYLNPNSQSAEFNGGPRATATGFIPGTFGSYGARMIYIAVRRGPMKVPTLGTSVFGLNARTGTGANATVTGGQIDDAVIVKNRGAAQGALWASRLTLNQYLQSSGSAIEATSATVLQTNPWDVMNGVKVGTTSAITNASGNTFINYFFKRAPSFFDVVCYTGTGSATTFSHNLGAVPELMIVKDRTGVNLWTIYNQAIGPTYGLWFQTNPKDLDTYWNNTTPTSTVFTVGPKDGTNQSGNKFIAYLFATCAGVSKVGSYTGTATTKQIDCGFTAGARFVLIKRTDSTGDWYVWDTARGIVSGNDSYFLINSTAAEVTGTDYIDTYSAGFEISSTAPAAINASGGAFIFLAIA